MPVEYICNGCGKREPGHASDLGDWHKPYEWFQRTINGVTQLACSRECVNKIGGLVSPW